MDTGKENVHGPMQRAVGRVAIGSLVLTYGALYFLSQHDEVDAKPVVALEDDLSHLESGAIVPIFRPTDLDRRKVKLGERLFHDERLSANGQVSCATCHDVANGGSDGLRTSIGVSGQPVAVNSPTVLNSSLNFRQFWDGRAEDLTGQIDGPMKNPNEMGLSWERSIVIISSDQGYVQAFNDVYPEGISEHTIKDAIVEYERSLVTPNAPFDRFLLGNESALNEQERRGYRYFLEFGCASCHQGRNIGGNLFHKLGVVRNYFSDRGIDSPSDLGRFNVTGDEADRHVFKVPSLRNIALTAPYLHDGSIASLEEVVMVMAYYQLGRRISAEETNDITAFLKTLTGDLPNDPRVAAQ